MPSRERWVLATSLIVVLVAVVFGQQLYRWFAIYSAPRERHTRERTGEAIAADTMFWHTFHAGRYDSLPATIEVLTRAYVATPNDHVTAAHLGWLHMWRMAERARLDTVPASIVDEMFLARRYFYNAVHLYRSDPRTLGFLASADMGTGAIRHNDREIRRGYFTMLDAIDAWPAFNLFTGGYTLSTSPAASSQFQTALDWQWRDLDICAGTHVDRVHPDFSPYMSRITTKAADRACVDSWIAPHNFEGFFLNMGDMLVKAGQWQTARQIYATAKLSPAYRTWPYAAVLEARIENAESNVARFSDHATDPKAGLMVTSAFSCMACHQE